MNDVKCYCDFIQESERLESQMKLFEDLEFQQLENESRLEEERETANQQLLQNKGECQKRIAHRKVRVLVYSYIVGEF